MNPKEKSLHEQIVQYKHEHGIKEAVSNQPKQDVFDLVAGERAKKKLDAKACAARVRRAYPHAYDDFDDATLTRKVLAKYPEYCDIASSGGRTSPQPQFETRESGLYLEAKSR